MYEIINKGSNMRYLKYFFLFFFVIVQVNAFSIKYASEPFLMGVGVRNFALGKTGVSDINSPAVAYWNSSLLLLQENMKYELMHAEVFNGLLKYDTFSGTFGRDYAMGFTLARIGINNIALTKLPFPDREIGEENQPYKYKSVNNSD